MAVKVRAVDARKLDLAADRHAAAAAHARAVDHDRVQRDDGLHAERLRGLGDELHHRDRADGEHLVILLTGFQQLLELDGDKALFAIGAVVGHEVQVVARRLELVLEDDDVLVAEADDDISLDARFLKRLRGRIGNRTADAAADHADALLALDVRRLAERTDEVLNIVALVHAAEQLGRQTDLLENDCDRALFAVVTGDGQRHPLRLVVHAEDNELTGFRLPRHERSFDLHIGDGGIEFLLTYDLVHSVCSSLHLS